MQHAAVGYRTERLLPHVLDKAAVGNLISNIGLGVSRLDCQYHVVVDDGH